MNERQKIIWLSIVVGVIIIAFILVLGGLIKENSQCTRNPFIYGVKSLEKRAIFSVCHCSLSQGHSVGDIYFDNSGVIKEDEYLFNYNSLFSSQ